MHIFLKGMLTCASLIIAIGSQNAFVLKKGILRQHVFAVALCCFICDFVLISIGVLGFGSATLQSPTLSRWVGLFGFVFLSLYALLAFVHASQSNLKLTASQQATSPKLWVSVGATLAITLLNPHVYIDTVFLIGSIAAPLSWDDKLLFLQGALLVSLLWFFGLAYGARMLQPLFLQPISWRLLHFFTGLIMAWLAYDLWRMAFPSA